MKVDDDNIQHVVQLYWQWSQFYQNCLHFALPNYRKRLLSHLNEYKSLNSDAALSLWIESCEKSWGDIICSHEFSSWFASSVHSMLRQDVSEE